MEREVIAHVNNKGMKYSIGEKRHFYKTGVFDAIHDTHLLKMCGFNKVVWQVPEKPILQPYMKQWRFVDSKMPVVIKNMLMYGDTLICVTQGGATYPANKLEYLIIE